MLLLGDRIRKYRKKAGLTLTDLAGNAGIAKSYLSNLERNQRKRPSVDIILKIAKELQIPVELLVPDIVETESNKKEVSISNFNVEYSNLIIQLTKVGIPEEEIIEFIKWKIEHEQDIR
ncbi:helix-turn-helix domain-containing protein [Evansella sp. AB-rgal1]|uniref:helix-turn-helix domain-containing protein n=1 Tax=Evansella sp. AB-rgal1 TaxID=3242696 RepID=UPI00359EABD0